MYIQDLIAVVGREALAQPRRAAQRSQLARYVGAAHRNHFDRQREAAQHLDPLAGISDADETLGHGRHDLLARQSPAPALDHRQAGVDLIGAVHVHRHRRHVVQVDHRQAPLAQAGRTAFGACDGRGNRITMGSQRVDEKVRGRSGADADHRRSTEMARDAFDRGQRDGPFQIVLRCQLRHPRPLFLAPPSPPTPLPQAGQGSQRSR